MNIFALDRNPRNAAEYHCDKHVNKMLLESTQILNGSLYERDLNDLAFYGYTHKHHPCTLWAAKSWENFNWLISLTHWLNREWQIRYDHEDNHTSYQKLLDNWRPNSSWVLPAKEEPLTEFALAMPDDVKENDAVSAYRKYYRQYKMDKDWFDYSRGRDQPDWLHK